MAAKKGKGGVGGEARRAAGQMSKQQIKDFLKKKGETVNEQAFIQGFLAKCAEANVDPEALVKWAQAVMGMQPSKGFRMENSVAQQATPAPVGPAGGQLMVPAPTSGELERARMNRALRTWQPNISQALGTLPGKSVQTR